MYKKNNKKRGSSFVLVVIIMAILFTLGTSMLTVTASDYKMRVSESNRLRNLYGADSGLDVVENIIVKTSQKAIGYAEEIVFERMDTFANDEEINARFKKEFFNFISLTNWKYVNEDGVMDGIVETPLIGYSILNKKYVKTLENINELSFNDVSVNGADVTIKSYEEVLNEDTNVLESIVIGVTSTFENTGSELKDKKTIETSFEIKAPDFNRSLVNEDVKVAIDIYPIFDGKTIVADGNMFIAGVNNIIGDIWVKGDSQLGEKPAYAFDKYRGGISVENGELNLTGNISTSRTLHLKNAARAIVTGNIYALNAYVGKSDKSGTSSNNAFRINTGGNLVVNNDLALNAQSSEINLHNFYGINDKTATDVSNLDKAMKSSSIIVNDTGGNSTLNISNETYVMGVAYIDTKDEKYQTGESVAVKGNYLAYSDILDSYKNKVTLKYYNPLQLIDTIEGEVDKGQYFKDYYSANNSNLKSGGITLNANKVHTVGAYVNNGTADYAGWTLDGSDTVIKSKREAFAQNVFSMGDTSGVLSDSVDKYKLYTDGNVIKDVANQVKFKNGDGTSSIPSDYEFNESYGKVIFNSEVTSDVVIKRDKITVGTREIAIEEDEINGLIITSGKVIIDGKVIFNGTIISGDDVEIKGTETKKLNHDVDLVRKIIASNYDVLEPIFLGTAKSQIDAVDVTIGKSVGVEGDFAGYQVSDYVESRRWKIKQ